MTKLKLNQPVVLISLAASFSFISCKTPSPKSEEKIFNGNMISRYAKNWVHPVVKIGFESSFDFNCTATAVSADTLITAAHCLTNPKPANKDRYGTQAITRCIKNGIHKGKCSSAAFVAPHYAGVKDVSDGKGRLPQADVAFLHFPEKPFNHFFTVRDDFVFKVNDTANNTVLVMGYAYRGLTSRDISLHGSKRWGEAVISEYFSDDYGGQFKIVGIDSSIDPGDSGGAGFKECQYVGVLSANNDPEIILAQRNKQAYEIKSFLTALSDAKNRNYLNLINNNKVHICGLPETKSDFCPDAGKYIPNPVVEDKKDFPCVRNIPDQTEVPPPPTKNTSGVFINRKNPKIGVDGGEYYGRFFINRIYQSHAAHQLGWETGWYILTVNDEKIVTLTDLRNALQGFANDPEVQSVKFLILPGEGREEEIFFVNVPFANL